MGMFDKIKHVVTKEEFNAEEVSDDDDKNKSESEVKTNIKALGKGAQQAVDEAEKYERKGEHNEPTCTALVYFVDQFGLPDHGWPSPRLRGSRPSTARAVLEQFARLPLETVHHYALNGEFAQSLLKERRLVDLLIHVGDRHFFAHRMIVCNHSRLLADLIYDTDVGPNVVTDITLKSVDPELFKNFLYFAYTGDIDLNSSNIGPMMHLCQALGSTTLDATMMTFLSTQEPMSLDQALDILLKDGNGALVPLAEYALAKYFQNVIDDASLLLQLPETVLTNAVKSDGLCVRSEMEVFWAILMWVAFDVASRTQHLDDLMSYVRFSVMSPLELVDCARVTSLIQKSERCRDMLVNASWVSQVRQVGLQDPFSLPHHNPRACAQYMPPYRPTVADFDRKYLRYQNLLASSVKINSSVAKKKVSKKSMDNDKLVGTEQNPEPKPDAEDNEPFDELNSNHEPDAEDDEAFEGGIFMSPQHSRSTRPVHSQTSMVYEGENLNYTWENDDVLLEKSISIQQTRSSPNSFGSRTYDMGNNAVLFERSIFIQQKHSKSDSDANIKNSKTIHYSPQDTSFKSMQPKQIQDTLKEHDNEKCKTMKMSSECKENSSCLKPGCDSFELMCLNPFYVGNYSESGKQMLSVNNRDSEDTHVSTETAHTRFITPATVYKRAKSLNTIYYHTKSLSPLTINAPTSSLSSLTIKCRTRSISPITKDSFEIKEAILGNQQSNQKTQTTGKISNSSNHTKNQSHFSSISSINVDKINDNLNQYQSSQEAFVNEELRLHKQMIDDKPNISNMCIHQHSCNDSLRTSNEDTTDNHNNSSENASTTCKQKTALQLWESNPLETADSVVLGANILLPTRNMKAGNLSREKNPATVRFSEKVEYQH